MKNSEKIAVFIDGQNLYYSAKLLGLDIDYRNLLKAFGANGSLVRAYFYTTINESDEFHSVRPLIDWLDYNGFTVRAKPAKEFDDGEGRRKVKRSIGIEFAVDALELAEHVDRMVLFTGDGDYRMLVEALQRRGVHVSVVSTLRTKPPMLADELRRQVDTFIELDDLRLSIGRVSPPAAPNSERKPRIPAKAVHNASV